MYRPEVYTEPIPVPQKAGTRSHRTAAVTLFPEHRITAVTLFPEHRIAAVMLFTEHRIATVTLFPEPLKDT